jgi:hypothetical protein
MARTTIKSTYSLDVETVRKLDALAVQWHVAKSEVLRRAIELATREQAASVPDPLQALEELQRRVKARFSRRQIEGWAAETRRERVKSSARHEWRQA